MDTIRRKRAEQRELEDKQKQEETFHNAVNKGRELLKPLWNDQYKMFWVAELKVLLFYVFIISGPDPVHSPGHSYDYKIVC